MHCYSIHEPIGVCALITPWNYPLLMALISWLLVLLEIQLSTSRLQ